MSFHHGILVKAPVRPRSQLALLPRQVRHSHPLQRPYSHISVPPHKRSASAALAGTHSAIGADPRAGRGPFPKPRPEVLPMVSFGLPNLAGLDHIHNADSDLVHHQFRLSFPQWNPGPARRNPTQIIATCGRFRAVIL